jgi:hypothetical protein
MYLLHTSKNICTTSHQRKHLYITPAKHCTSHQQQHLYNITPATTYVHHTSNNICTTSHQQKHLYNITPATTSVHHANKKHLLLVWRCTDVFAGVMLYRCFCWCDVVQMLLLECCTDVVAGVVLYMFLLV